MLAYAQGFPSEPLLPITVAECFDRAADAFAARTCLISRHQNLRFTFGDLRAAATRTARALLAHGIGRGDRVGIWSGNCAEWLIVQYAVAKVGAVLVHINPAYRERDLEYVMDDSGAALVFAASRFMDNDCAATLRAIARARQAAGTAMPAVVSLPPATDPAFIAWNDFLASGDGVSDADVAHRTAAVELDDPSNLIYTSGTTGTPKGVRHTHHAVVNAGVGTGRRLRYTSDDRLCLAIPFHHVFGCILGNIAALAHGTCVVVPGLIFEPRSCMTAVEQERCTALYGVPTMFLALMADATFDTRRFDTLRTGIVAGAPCPEATMRLIAERLHMPELTVSYGMTESPAICQSAVDEPFERRVQTTGSLHAQVECKIVDPATNRIVQRGVPGELCARSYAVMLGYTTTPPGPNHTADDRRWVHTGDLAVMHEDGWISVVGRIKDMIIRGGENVYPQEIEAVLGRHPQVRDAYVVGVPDAHYGEEIAAWLQVDQDRPPTAQEIRQYCRGHLGVNKRPQHVWFVNDWPMTASGKVQKFRLREMAIERLAQRASQANA